MHHSPRRPGDAENRASYDGPWEPSSTLRTERRRMYKHAERNVREQKAPHFLPQEVRRFAAEHAARTAKMRSQFVLSNLADWITDIIDSLGFLGAALLVALDNVFTPISSEIVLPLPVSWRVTAILT